MILSCALDERHSELLKAIMRKLKFNQKNALSESIQTLGIKLKIITCRDSFLQDGVKKGAEQ